ncbi:MAG: LytR C-terminal domain-containing protein [Clostridiales bacterium]|jgi:hypothetical protein|nr:LytR C-terminal domain-containing protein [Eubacteriales bacterium]MDH7565555.1 LytR C-terminal domain-containing protein [Clostridiales bacterium]
MNKKLFFNMVFFIVGTFMVVLMATIVALNFARDARIFQKAVVTATVEDTSKPAEEGGPDDFKTVQYKRAEEPAQAKTDTKNEEGTSPKPEKIKVEVINYTNVKNLAEEVRATLEASGYSVSAGNKKTNSPQSTLIVERNDKKAGEGIQKILKAGKVVKWADPNSKYDVTVIIGDDFKP